MCLDTHFQGTLWTLTPFVGPKSPRPELGNSEQESWLLPSRASVSRGGMWGGEREKGLGASHQVESP